MVCAAVISLPVLALLLALLLSIVLHAFVGDSFGHVPHDVVVSVGAPLALDASQPWLMVAGSDEIHSLSRSDDGGESWQMIGGDPLKETLVGVAVLDDGTWVAASTSTIWWSSDEGSTWRPRRSPGPIAVIAGGESLLIGGARGVWAGNPRLVQPLPMRSAAVIGVSADGRAVVDDDDHVWSRRVGAEELWVDHGFLGGANAVTLLGDIVYAGDTDGVVFRRTSIGWQECGALPDVLGAHSGVVRLAASPATFAESQGVLLAVSGDGGPYRSLDGCASWEDLHGPLVTVYTGSGSASSSSQAAVALGVAGERWMEAGWAGFAVADAGSVWQPVILPADYTRGIGFSPDFDRDRTVYVGGYAAGVLTTEDGGSTWRGAGEGLDVENVQRVSGMASDADVVLSVTGHVGWVSEDRGVSWRAVHPPVGTLGELFALGADNRVWAFGSGQGAQVAFSDDLGKSWSKATAMTAALAGSTPSGLVRVASAEGTAMVLGGGGPTRLVYSLDDGLTWDQRFTGSDGRISGPVGWPESAPRRIVVADDAGVYTSDDGGTWTTWDGFGDDVPLVLASAGDRVYLTTRSGHLWRSDDGALSFLDLGVQLNAPVHILVGNPNFEQDPKLLIGTHDGVFTVDDPLSDSPELLRWAPYQRVDDGSAYFACRSCGDRIEDRAAGLGQLRELGADGVASVTLRGQSIALYGTIDSGAVAELWIDGAWVATVDKRAQTPVLLTRVDGLLPGWHAVEVRALSDGVAVDAIVGSGPGVSFGQSASPGCATAPSGPCSLLVAGIVALALRRGRTRRFS